MAEYVLLLAEGTGTDHLLLSSGDDLLLAVSDDIITGTLTGTFGGLTATMVGAPTFFGTLVGAFGGLIAIIEGTGYDPAATYADLQRSLWDADLATNLSHGSLTGADLAPSLWRADLQP